jgi:hypothetical protein
VFAISDKYENVEQNDRLPARAQPVGSGVGAGVGEGEGEGAGATTATVAHEYHAVDEKTCMVHAGQTRPAGMLILIE